MAMAKDTRPYLVLYKGPGEEGVKLTKHEGWAAVQDRLQELEDQDGLAVQVSISPTWPRDENSEYWDEPMTLIYELAPGSQPIPVEVEIIYRRGQDEPGA